MLDSKTVNKFSEFLKDAEVIEGLKAFKEKELGEVWHSFKPLGDRTTIEITHYDGKPVMLVATRKDDGDYQFRLLPIIKAEAYTESDQFSDFTRVIVRVNDKLELLSELVVHQMMDSLTFDKNGFPTHGKTFEIIEGFGTI